VNRLLILWVSGIYIILVGDKEWTQVGFLLVEALLSSLVFL